PLDGGPKPSRSSSSVVLPAPFLPSTATTSPASALTEMPSSTCFEPMLLPSASARTIGSAIVALPTFFDQRLDLLGLELELPCREHEPVDFVLDLAQAVAQRRLRPRPLRDRHGLAAVANEHAFRFEQRVRL